MKIEISRFTECDIDTVHEIQRSAFKPLYEKYCDDDLNPYKETKEAVLEKYTRAGTVGYLFVLNGKAVGAVRIKADKTSKRGRVSALCILPQYQNLGIAQSALLEIERMHPEVEIWSLDTILQETGNCHLYEKIGYEKTGISEVINERMTLVNYEKVKTNA